MKRTIWMVLLAAVVGCQHTEAGVLRRRPVAVAVSTPTLIRTTTTETAQGAANLIVWSGRFRHVGGNRGPEGIGMGLTPAAAEASCCFRQQMVPRDRGFARLANGMWVCVCRY
jgi:hypothetical protein